MPKKVQKKKQAKKSSRLKKQEKFPWGLKIIIGVTFLNGLYQLTFLNSPFTFTKIVAIFFSIAFLIVGIGLIKKSNKARIALIFLHVLGICLNGLALLMRVMPFSLFVISNFIVSIIVISYLAQPRIEKIYGSSNF